MLTRRKPVVNSYESRADRFALKKKAGRSRMCIQRTHATLIRVRARCWERWLCVEPCFCPSRPAAELAMARGRRKPRALDFLFFPGYSSGWRRSLQSRGERHEFRARLTANWNGVSRDTTFVDAKHSSASIPAVDRATPGTIDITVVNPSTGGGASNSLHFVVTPPASVGFGVVQLISVAADGGVAELAKRWFATYLARAGENGRAA